ncbi:MAG: hypothetical protein KC933_35230 [Myxococcales bacterium]|nr:hypothetical protein [Myxococcales bacterium]
MLQIIHLPKPRIFAAFALALATFGLVGSSVVCAARSDAGIETATMASPPVQQRPELPREWVWKKDAVRFDGMFRTM